MVIFLIHLEYQITLFLLDNHSFANLKTFCIDVQCKYDLGWQWFVDSVRMFSAFENGQWKICKADGSGKDYDSKPIKGKKFLRFISYPSPEKLVCPTTDQSKLSTPSWAMDKIFGQNDEGAKPRKRGASHSSRSGKDIKKSNNSLSWQNRTMIPLIHISHQKKINIRFTKPLLYITLYCRAMVCATITL